VSALPTLTGVPAPHGAEALGEDDIARALAVPTRAGIYRRLRTEARPLSAAEVAERFGVHVNVARNHLDRLVEVGLAASGRRKNPLGGRPAKVYVAREQAAPVGRDVPVPPGAQLAVHTIVQLIAGLREHLGRLELLAEEQGRRLVAAAAGRAAHRELGAAAVVAVEALRAAFPEVRLTDDPAGAAPDHAVVVEGLEVSLRLIGEVDGSVGDALAVGFLRGALAAAGAPAIVHARDGRVRAERDARAVGAVPGPVATIDARGRRLEQGVDEAVRVAGSLRPGDHLEVLTDLEGAPAAYARWADRAGHELVDVARVRDARGRPTVRIMLRTATGR